MIKLKHKDGLFGTPEVGCGEYDDDDIPYYLEFVDSPFSLISSDLDGTGRINLTNGVGFNSKRVVELINDGVWVIFE